MQKQNTQDGMQLACHYVPEHQSIQISHSPKRKKDHFSINSASITPHKSKQNIRQGLKINMICKLFMSEPIKRFCQSFAAGFAFQTSTNLIPAIFSRRNKLSWNKIQKIYSSKDSLLFASMCGLISFTFKAILSILKQCGLNNSLWQKTLAGFISGVWILLDTKQRRNKLALYCIIRSLADLIRVCIHYKKIPNIKHGNIIAFTASQMIIMYATFKDPKNLDSKYYKWIMNMGDLRERSVQQTLRSPSGAMYRLPNEAFVKCYPIYHKHPSCLSFNLKQWFSTVIRASKIYFPVHFLPAIIFKPKSLIKHGWVYGPINFVKIKLSNTLISSMFLATYVFNAKYTMCVLRNVICDDPAYVSICGGFMSGLSLLIENPKRRSELMLYCIPKAVEFCINRAVNGKQSVMLCKVLQTNVLPTIVFQTALAVWLTIYHIPNGSENCNFINMKVLQIIFGGTERLAKDAVHKSVNKNERFANRNYSEMDRNK